MINAKSASELPCNRQQVYDSHHRSAPSQGKVDPSLNWYSNVKLIICLVEGGGFIRSVNFEMGLCRILASNYQLQNIVRFCTNPRASSVFGIDPTFSLGKFYVTLTTFTCTQVVNKSTNLSPTFFGPVSKITSHISTFFQL